MEECLLWPPPSAVHRMDALPEGGELWRGSGDKPPGTTLSREVNSWDRYIVSLLVIEYSSSKYWILYKKFYRKCQNLSFQENSTIKVLLRGPKTAILMTFLRFRKLIKKVGENPDTVHECIWL